MALIDVNEIINLTPQLLHIPFKRIWCSYDEEADVLYLNFKKPSHADDSGLTDDDIIIRYETSMSQRLTKDDENNPPIPPLEKGGKGGFEGFSGEKGEVIGITVLHASKRKVSDMPGP